MRDYAAVSFCGIKQEVRQRNTQSESRRNAANRSNLEGEVQDIGRIAEQTPFRDAPGRSSREHGWNDFSDAQRSEGKG